MPKHFLTDFNFPNNGGMRQEADCRAFTIEGVAGGNTRGFEDEVDEGTRILALEELRPNLTDAAKKQCFPPGLTLHYYKVTKERSLHRNSVTI